MKHICVALLAALCLLTSCGKQEKDPEPIGPETKEEIGFDLMEKKVFLSDELDFVFVIAKVRIRKEGGFSYELKEVTTSENLSLADTQIYRDKLVQKGISLHQYVLAESLESDSDSAVFTLFVPVRNTNNKTVTLYLKDKSVVIDLESDVVSIDEEASIDTITEEDYRVLVLGIHPATGQNLYLGGEVTTYPSTAELFAVSLRVEALGESDVIISEAEYVTYQNSDSFTALDSGYEGTDKYDNIIGYAVSDKAEGELLFMSLNPEQEVFTYTGILRLKINGSWYNVHIGESDEGE